MNLLNISNEPSPQYNSISNLPILYTPRRNELAQPISPHILINRNSNEQRASNRLIRVNRIRTDDTRERSHRNARTRVSNEHDNLPRPVSLISNRNNNIAQEHDNNIGNHSRQSHFGFTNSIILSRRPSTDPIRQRTRSKQPKQGPKERGEVSEADDQGCHVVWWCGEDLALREVGNEEARARPADDEGGEFDDGEREEFPGGPEVKEYRAEGMRVWLEEPPLPFSGLAASEVWVFGCGFGGG